MPLHCLFKETTHPHVVLTTYYLHYIFSFITLTLHLISNSQAALDSVPLRFFCLNYIVYHYEPFSSLFLVSSVAFIFQVVQINAFYHDSSIWIICHAVFTYPITIFVLCNLLCIYLLHFSEHNISKDKDRRL